MTISDISIKRPALAIVISVLVTLVGALCFRNLPVREYPDIDKPVVTVTTSYPGANAEVVETTITEPLEEQLSAIDGIIQLKSESREQVSQITIEFALNRDVDIAASDVRDRVARARDRLPDEVDEPQIAKVEADSSPVIYLALNSDQRNLLELTDLADRIIKQRVQTVPGVGTVSISGEKRFAMRVWLNPDQLAAFGLSTADITDALLAQNVELPGGRIESQTREFTVQVEGDLTSVSQFENLVVAVRGGTQILLSDLARVELGSADYRARTYYNGKPAVGVMVIRQAQSNLLDVANGVKDLVPELRASLPEDVSLEVASDSSIFVENSIQEVEHTVLEAVGLVILVIFLFLRDWRATLIPILAIPVSLIGTFAVMLALGFTVNILTLLAIVLAVGLVVDDAIVMMENIFRRIEHGEPAIRAALHGSREVGFAIVATTLTLMAVFVPVAFQSGTTGRLFYEFGFTLAIAVLLSMVVSLTLSPMLSSRILKVKLDENGKPRHNWLWRVTEPFFRGLERGFGAALKLFLKVGFLAPLLVVAAVLAIGWIYRDLPKELVPDEDRGVIQSMFNGPLGSTPDATDHYMRQMDAIVRAEPAVNRNFMVVAAGRGTAGEGAEGRMFTRLQDWSERDIKTQELQQRFREAYSKKITGGLAIASLQRPLQRGSGGDDLTFLIQGDDFDELDRIANEVLGRMRDSGLFAPSARIEPRPTKPQLLVDVDRSKAADLGVSVREIGTTLQTLFGSREVTRFQRGNRQYDVVLQVEDRDRITPSDLARITVRGRAGLISLSNLVTIREDITPEKFPHYSRQRTAILRAQLAPGVTLDQGIRWFEAQADQFPADVTHGWDGQVRDYLETSSSVIWLFGLALLFSYLILVAQFESWIHPVTIFTGIILAVAAGMGFLWLSSRGLLPGMPKMTFNLFSQFGLILLIGLVAKNGILIVEFANQLRLEGKNAHDAAVQSSILRLRPILMTAIATAVGAVPLMLTKDAGAETRNPLGLVVVTGVTVSTLFTLFVVPAFYIGFDWIVTKLTGHGSARGLELAEAIDREALQVDEEIHAARSHNPSGRPQKTSANERPH